MISFFFFIISSFFFLQPIKGSGLNFSVCYARGQPKKGLKDMLLGCFFKIGTSSVLTECRYVVFKIILNNIKLLQRFQLSI